MLWAESVREYRPRHQELRDTQILVLPRGLQMSGKDKADNEAEEYWEKRE